MAVRDGDTQVSRVPVAFSNFCTHDKTKDVHLLNYIEILVIRNCNLTA